MRTYCQLFTLVLLLTLFKVAKCEDLIVYDWYNGSIGQVFRANQDFSSSLQLTNSAFSASQPAVSPDGRYVVYSQEESSDHRANLWIVNSDGSGARQLTFNSISGGKRAFMPCWHPNGQTVYYTQETVGPYGVVREVAIDGTADNIVVSNSSGGCYAPAINPADATQLAYVLQATYSQNGEIRLRSLVDGAETVLLAPNGAADYHLMFSPDGQFLLWSEQENGSSANFALKRMLLSDHTVTTLVHAPSDLNVYGAYAPDGQYIYYSTTHGATYAVTQHYKMNADGSGATLLYTQPGTGRGYLGNASVAPDPLAVGLVAYYPFSGNADDASGFNHNGVVENATLAPDRCGTPDRAYYFNGNSSIITFLGLDWNTAASFTTSAWFKRGYDDIGIIFNQAHCYPQAAFQLNVSHDVGNRKARVCLGNPDGLWHAVDFEFDDTLSWHHMVLVYNKEVDSMYQYFDGLLIGAQPIDSVNDYSGSAAEVTAGFLKGCESYGHFQGSIDEIRAYTRALSQIEIQALYNESSCNGTDFTIDMTPDTIVYNCAGDFAFDVNIGDGVTALDAANVWMTYPAELSVSSVNALDANFFLAYTQSTNILNTRDTLKVNLGVLSGSTNGPDGLFAVAMNGSVSCISGDITMTYLDLRDSTNSPIVVPMASPIDFQSNCGDPTIVVNSPVTGGFYNTNPVLSLTAGDDCDLDAVYYQIDGCTPGGWLPIATGLTGTAYNNAAWSMTGAEFTALTEASHCIRFKVTDDFGRANSDSCTYTWCFTKDITAPLAPTALVAQPGHNKIQLTWTNSSSADVVGVKIQRVPWTDSPDYGSTPTPTPAPSYPANQGVGTTVLTAAATPSSPASHLDVIGLSNATRDIYYFGAFAYDAAGNYSVAAVPAQARSTSYWLGDIGLPFDGNVYFTDLTVFTSTYGLNEGQGGYVNHADFGPTHNNSPKGIPLPDDMVEFEDLAIFAINFNNVAPMAAKNTPTLTGAPIEQTAGLQLVDRLTNDGYYVDLYLSNRSNDAKSLIGEISFDPTQLKYVSSTIGNDLASPSLPIFYKPLVGDNKVSISAAVLGQGSAFTGSGVVATLKFQTRSATAPRARLTRAEIRDNENNSIVEQIQIVEQPEPISEVALPTRYTVGQNSPNPFNPETSISYGLPTATKVSIRVYNIMGQLVRTLVDDYQAAGTHEVVWNGTTDSGSKVASGIYFYRFETADFQKTVKMTMLK